MEKTVVKNKGFTLLELMIAISIFSGLVILVVASFASSVNYQTRVKVNREVSESARSAIDAMAREVNLSWNGPVSVNQTIQIQYKNQSGQNEPVYNFAVLNNDKNGNFASDTGEGDVLVVRDDTNYCRRYYLTDNNHIALQIREKEGCLGRWGETHYLTNDNIKVTDLKFTSSPNIKSSTSAPSLEISFTLKNSSSFYGDDLTIKISPETTVTVRNIGREKLSNE